MITEKIFQKHFECRDGNFTVREGYAGRTEETGVRLDGPAAFTVVEYWGEPEASPPRPRTPASPDRDAGISLTVTDAAPRATVLLTAAGLLGAAGLLSDRPRGPGADPQT